MRLTTPTALDRVDPTTGRTLYRIVQEALTNVRKHAPSASVEVTVGGSPGAGLDVTVHNTITGGAASGVPGSGTGLIGLRERAALAGGSLEHGHGRRRAPDTGCRHTCPGRPVTTSGPGERRHRRGDAQPAAGPTALTAAHGQRLSGRLPASLPTVSPTVDLVPQRAMHPDLDHAAVGEPDVQPPVQVRAVQQAARLLHHGALPGVPRHRAIPLSG